MRFVHCADIHLDSPLRGLDAHDAAPVAAARQATRRALDNLVQLCIEERARFLIIAGDLYDGDWQDFNTGLFFVRAMARLGAAGIEVFVLRGNHDAASAITKALRPPVYVRGFHHLKPQSIAIDDLKVVLHGQSFRQPAVTDNLAAGYPAPREGWFNIGVLHTSLTGRDGHERYAPCAAEELAARGYDYWALGHVHRREVVDDRPHIVFPGNLQGRHIRETGAKGCTLVEVAENRVVGIEHRAVDVLRWAMVEVEAAEAADAGTLLDRSRAALARAVAAAEGRLLAVRVKLAGHGPALDEWAARQAAWTQELHAAAADLGTDRLWIEKVALAAPPPPAPGSDGPLPDEALGEVARTFAELAGSEADLARLAAEFRDIANVLPPALRDGEDGVRPDDPDWLRGFLGRAARLAGARLAGGRD